MGKERNIQTEILNTLSKGDVRLFRQNVGLAWQGSSVVKMPGGKTMLIVDPRPVHCGLIEGSGDLIGWRRVRITPDMVGKELAVFASVEVKSSRGRPSKAQLRWESAVNGFGGLAGVARSVDEARSILMLDGD